MTAKLKIVTATHRPVVYDGPIPRESATEIAARLRAGKPPVRHLIYRESIDAADKREAVELSDVRRRTWRLA